MKLQLDYLFEQYGRTYRSFPPFETTHNPDHFYIACDTLVAMIEAETLVEAIQTFTDTVEGMPALYLIRDGEVLATYNGGQTEPEGELTYHVTKPLSVNGFGRYYSYPAASSLFVLTGQLRISN